MDLRGGRRRVQGAVSPKFPWARLDDFSWSYALGTKTKLKTGTYTLVARATDVKGTRSALASVTFKLK